MCPVLLQALVELCQVAPEQANLILDRLPINKSFLSSICRRTVKQLLEMNLNDVAEKLVLCTELTPENNTDKENAISSSPSVIVLSRILRDETDLVKAIAKIMMMKSSDLKIIPRSIVICFDLCFENPDKKSFYGSVIKELLRDNRASWKPTEELISQNITRKIQKTRTDNDVLFILKTSSDLGKEDPDRFFEIKCIKSKKKTIVTT